LNPPIRLDLFFSHHAGKPLPYWAVMHFMTDAQHVKFIWQLLALRKRMDVDPYGLSKDELMLLQSYDVADPNLTKAL
jgi:hypothetical protein